MGQALFFRTNLLSLLPTWMPEVTREVVLIGWICKKVLAKGYSDEGSLMLKLGDGQ